MASKKCCKQFNSKQMECQIGENEKCAICVKLPCNQQHEGLGGKCSDKVNIVCCKPEELEKCCKEKTGDKECCVCMLCEGNKIVQIVVECCGKRSELCPEPGNSVCICVPQTSSGGAKCGGQVQLKQCKQQALDECCKANTEGGDCCCVCLKCTDGICSAFVRCPESSATAGGGGQCGTVPCC